MVDKGVEPNEEACVRPHQSISNTHTYTHTPLINWLMISTAAWQGLENLRWSMSLFSSYLSLFNRKLYWPTHMYMLLKCNKHKNRYQRIKNGHLQITTSFVIIYKTMEMFSSEHHFSPSLSDIFQTLIEQHYGVTFHHLQPKPHVYYSLFHQVSTSLWLVVSVIHLCAWRIKHFPRRELNKGFHGQGARDACDTVALETGMSVCKAWKELDLQRYVGSLSLELIRGLKRCLVTTECVLR